jgi:cell division protein FtsB
MSEGHFHAHGPHDHEVEHAAHSGDPFAGRIAVMTAIFATIGALFGYMAGATQNEALLFKNEAAIRKTEASDQWSFYQAKSGKQNLAELGATLTTGEQQAKYQKEIERYKKEKDDIMAEAKKLEEAGKDAEKKSEAAMHVHHRWAQAMTLIQIGIALAAITILTRRKAMGAGALAVGAGSVVLGALAFAHI